MLRLFGGSGFETGENGFGGLGGDDCCCLEFSLAFEGCDCGLLGIELRGEVVSTLRLESRDFVVEL